MIRLKLGRRVVALLSSVLLLSASVLPAFATSTSGQLPEVGWAETVSSFLMASGIYPFESDPETGYEEWSVSSLKALWDEFREDTTQVAYDIVDLTGNLVKGVIAIASGRWSVLREFATWIVSKYNVTDNQTGVELGTEISGMFSLSVGSSVSVGRYNGSQVSILRQDSTYQYYLCYAPRLNYESQGQCAFVITTQPVPQSPFYAPSGAVQVVSGSVLSLINDSVSYRDIYFGWSYPLSSETLNGSIPAFSDYKEAVDFYISNGGAPSFQGITADTTTVSIPAALPEGTDFGGLAVSGTGVAVTPEQLEEIVKNAVKEALKPSVAVVPVALSPDVSVTPSGEITVSGDVTIDSGNIPLQPSDYSAPNISKVFPFSIPWDILAILNVLDAEPVRPEFNVDVYIPVVDVHVPWTIGVSEELQEPVDNFMASMRLLLLASMCVGTLWLFWRSNL